MKYFAVILLLSLFAIAMAQEKTSGDEKVKDQTLDTARDKRGAYSLGGYSPYSYGYSPYSYGGYGYGYGLPYSYSPYAYSHPYYRHSYPYHSNYYSPYYY